MAIISLDEAQQLEAKGQLGNSTDQFTTAQFGALPQTTSPLSLTDEAVMSFGDAAGNEQYLRKKFNFVEPLENGSFAVGNDPQNLTPIQSPEFNILHAAASLAGQIPVLTGQILGAMVGTLGEPGLGTVAGGAAGAAGGELVREGIGRAFGVNQAKAEEVATNTALAGVFGAAGEGLGIGIAKAGGVLAPRITKALDTILASKGAEGQSKFINMLAKTAHITANIPEEATRAVPTLGGFTEVLRKPYLNPEFYQELTTRAVESVQFNERLLGDQVNTAAASLIRASQKKPVIDLTDTFQQLTQDLKAINVLQPGNVINKYSNVQGKNYFYNILSQIGRRQEIAGDVLGRFGEVARKEKLIQFVIPNREFGIEELIKFRREAQDVFAKLGPEGQSALLRFKDGFDRYTNSATKGLAAKLEEFGTQVGDTSLREANGKFANFTTAVEAMRKHGVDLKDAVSTQDFFKNYFSALPEKRKLLQLVDTLTPENKFALELQKFAVAQKFVGANPNMLRVMAVMGFVGIPRDQSLEGKLSRLGLGLALTTPAGVGTIFKAGERIGKSLTSQAVPKALTASQRRLLTATGSRALEALIRHNAKRPIKQP